MYPYILMNWSIPEGQPKVITSDLDTVTLPLKYKGYYKVDIVQAHVQYPILWMKWKGKLFFTCCSKCVKDGAEGQTPCNPSESERAIHISLTHLELEYCLLQGSKVLRCYEVYHFRRWGTSLFRPFLTKFIALKIQASGWERPDMTDAEKQQVIDDYKREGIDVDPSKMHKNPSARTIAKLAINSAWGKFSQRNQRPQTIIFNPELEFPAILNDPTVTLNGLCLVENMLMGTYTPVDEYVKELKGTSVAISAFCTAIGRILLTKNLERVGDRAIYCDTDSLIYYEEEGKDNLQDLAKNSEIGAWVSEIEDEWEITEFCSTGPKVYSYIKRKIDGSGIEDVCKVRGIVLDRGASIINFSSMNSLVDQLFTDEPPVPLITNRAQITKKLGKIETRQMIKRLNPVMNKLLFRNAPFNDTRPLGWRVGLDSFFDNEPLSRSPSPLILPSNRRGESDTPPPAADDRDTPDSIRVRFYAPTIRGGESTHFQAPMPPAQMTEYEIPTGKNYSEMYPTRMNQKSDYFKASCKQLLSNMNFVPLIVGKCCRSEFNFNSFTGEGRFKLCGACCQKNVKARFD